MTNRTIKILATLLALTCASVGDAQIPRQAPTRRVAPTTAPSNGGPLSMDVAGVRLGMSLAAAETALAGTYRCRRNGGFQTFQQLVDVGVAKRKGAGLGWPPQGTGVGELFCDGPSGESLRITMAQTASGPVVDDFNLMIPTNRVDPAAMARQLEAKYGKPTSGTASNGAWCSGRCSPLVSMAAGPAITSSLSGPALQILGTRGQLASDADKAAVQAAVDRISPPARRGAF